MPSLSSLDIYRKLTTFALPLISPKDFQRIFSIQNKNTAYATLQRLEKEGVLSRVKGGVYHVSSVPIHDFTLANHLYVPSYISLESALSRYGILSQFPHVITSITTKESTTVETGKTFEYVHIAPHMYYGYIKEKGYIIATPEKALLDSLYLVSKGIRSIPLDELDWNPINKTVFREYCKKTRIPQFQRYIKTHTDL